MLARHVFVQWPITQDPTPHHTIPQQQHNSNSNNTKLNSLSISSFLNLVHTFILFYFIFCFFIKLLKTPSPLGPDFGLNKLSKKAFEVNSILY